MIYIIADINSFRKEVSLNRVTMLLSLTKRDDIRLVYDKHFNYYNICKNDIIIFFFIRLYFHKSCYLVKDYINFLKPIKVKKYIYIEDFYKTQQIHNFCQYHQLDNIIYSMKHEGLKNKLLTYNPDYNIYSLHNHFDLSIFPQTIPEKEYDILLYGITEKSVYPFRYLLLQILKKLCTKYKIKIIPFISYQKTPYSIVQNHLYYEISKSYLTVATRSQFDFLIKKYQEIPLSGSMILGNIPSNYSDLFNENTIVSIDETMDENTIVKKIEESLENKNELLQKTIQLQQIIRERFCMENCYKDLKSIIF